MTITAAAFVLLTPGTTNVQAGNHVDGVLIDPPPFGIAVAKPKKSVYAVKFLCGTYEPNNAGVVREGPVKPGNYQTAINIHNPSSGAVAFIKKAVLMFDSQNPPTGFEIPVPPHERHEAQLGPDWGMEIDCPDIRTVLLNMPATPGQEPFIKGWVVIEGPVTLPLDVVAAYTAHGFGVDSTGVAGPEGFSLEVVPVMPKTVF